LKNSDKQDFFTIILEDALDAVERRQAADTQAARRDQVRTAFIAIEGFVWVFREHIAEVANMTHGLEPEEEIVLAETSFQVGKDGKINSQSKYVPLLSMVRLVARIAKRIAPTAEVDFSGSGWNKTQEALQIRHRITHPKSRMDLMLSDADMLTIEHVLFWLPEQITVAMEHTNVAAKDYHGRFNDVLERLRASDPVVAKLYNALRDED